MTQDYHPYKLTCESESDESDIFWYDDEDEDEDRFCGDAEWEVSLAAVAWEARRKLYAEEKIKEANEEEALTHIRYLFEEKLELHDEECVTEKPNWDWDHYDSDCETESNSGSEYDDYSAFA